jgi:hypothetical protein
MPALSQRLLEALAAGAEPKTLEVDWAGEWVVSLA